MVLLGFEQPDLGTAEHKTSSPVQSVLARNLLYEQVVQYDWLLEGLDLATAFLQTQPLWTTGVAELREALQVGPEGVMKILKNIYSAKRPVAQPPQDPHFLASKDSSWRAVPMDLDQSDRKDPAGPAVIGYMGGHVDDFHRVGNPRSKEWQDICLCSD